MPAASWAHLRIANMLKGGFTGGDESRFHALYSDAIEQPSLMFRGVPRVRAGRIPGRNWTVWSSIRRWRPGKDEFIAMQMRQPQELDVFFTEMSRKAAAVKEFS